MRLAIFMAVLLLAACSKKGDITLCCERHWWGSTSKHFSSEQELDAYVVRERTKRLDIARKLSFDYASCAEKVLVSEVKEGQHASEHIIYVSVFESDPSVESLSRLKDVNQ